MEKHVAEMAAILLEKMAQNQLVWDEIEKLLSIDVKNDLALVNILTETLDKISEHGKDLQRELKAL